MKKTVKIITYSFIFFVPLIFFIYINSPKILIKEKIANILTKQTKSIVTIKDFSLSFPLGATLYGLEFYQPNIEKEIAT